MTTPTLDKDKTDAFGQQLAGVLNHAALALMISVGHRTGLFDALSAGEFVTSTELAEAGGLSERYVREWLAAMTTGGVVEYRAADRSYRLPPEHAAFLTRAASPNNFAASMQWVAVLGGVEDEVVEAFGHGRGVPYEAYHRFHEVMAEESEQSVVAALADHILPLVPGLPARLAAGIDVLDVGCGSGRAVLRMAELFPRSRFAGYYFSPEAVAAASQEADARGLPNARFKVKDVAALVAGPGFDLVTAFDAIHDQAEPARVLSNVAGSLRPGGVFLMQDISGSGDVGEDVGHPFGPLLYSISCLHCMSVSLACGGPGLGAMWGKRTALAMLRDAGFGRVRVESLPHDPMNFYYVAAREE